MQVMKTVTTALRSRMSQHASSPNKAGEGIKKWELYKHLCVAKSEFGLNDRCLTVLNSLLSFLSDDVITSKSKLVVFPSNKLISLRAHMMPESTLRRHLASLIHAGLITRKDSPNCKRYAHKSREGEVELAFGFDFAPFFAMSSIIKCAADRIVDEQRAIKRMRDEVSITRREIAKAFADANIDASDSLYLQFRDVVNAIPRHASLSELKTIKTSLDNIHSELSIALKNNDNVQNMSANDAQYERHHIESLSESLLIKKNNKFSELKKTASNVADQKSKISNPNTISLDMVLRAFPDIQSYATSPIRNWRELADTSRLVANFLGISNTAYIDAVRYLGLESASSAIAGILQKMSEIANPGGYLRSLVQKARGGRFSISDMLMGGLRCGAYQ